MGKRNDQDLRPGREGGGVCQFATPLMSSQNGFQLDNKSPASIAAMSSFNYSKWDNIELSDDGSPLTVKCIVRINGIDIDWIISSCRIL
jgi:hypothetical protein